MPFKSYSSKDAPRDSFGAIPKGRYDVTLTKIECRSSGKGHPQMVWTLTVDSGEHANTDLKDRFTFGDSDTAWAKLANICDVIGFEFEEAGSMESFAAQFPLNKMRLSVEVDHRYSAKAWIDVDNPYAFKKFTAAQTPETPYPHTINLQKHDWDAFEGEKTGPWAQIRDGFDYLNIYGKVGAERELELEENEDELAAAAAIINGASGDGLPF